MGVGGGGEGEGGEGESGGVGSEGSLESSYPGALETHSSYRISDTHTHTLSLTHSYTYRHTHTSIHTFPERSVSGR